MSRTCLLFRCGYHISVSVVPDEMNVSYPFTRVRQRFTAIPAKVETQPIYRLLRVTDCQYYERRML
jgi:hypothetical protein